MEQNKILNKISKSLDLTEEEYQQLIHDVNNLRGREWLPEVEDIKDENLIRDFQKLIGVRNYEDLTKEEVKEIKDYLKDMGGYIGYDDRVEDLMDEFNLDKATAESFVWNKASGLNQL